jgi:hypothetical protein
MKRRNTFICLCSSIFNGCIPFSHLLKSTVLKNIKTWFLLDLFNRNSFMMYEQVFEKGSLDTFFNLVSSQIFKFLLTLYKNFGIMKEICIYMYLQCLRL